MINIETINVMTLAYLGDSVYELKLRDYLVSNIPAKVDALQKMSLNYVSAKAQSKYVKCLIDNNFFTEVELDVIKRARNYKRSSHPKNTDIITYKYSSGFEALIGYLYLLHQNDRINEIILQIIGEK